MDVIPGLVPGIQPSPSPGACGTADPGHKASERSSAVPTQWARCRGDAPSLRRGRVKDCGWQSWAAHDPGAVAASGARHVSRRRRHRRNLHRFRAVRCARRQDVSAQAADHAARPLAGGDRGHRGAAEDRRRRHRRRHRDRARHHARHQRGDRAARGGDRHAGDARASATFSIWASSAATIFSTCA